MATQFMSEVTAAALRVRRGGRLLAIVLLGAWVLRLTGCGEPAAALRPEVPAPLGDRFWWADDNPTPP